MITLSSSDAHQNQRIQFLSSISSATSAPVAPENLYATHVMSSSVKSRGAISGTSLYSLKAVHGGFSVGGLVCQVASPGEPLQPVAWSLCIGHPVEDTLPSPCHLPGGRPAWDYQTILCHGSLGIQPNPPPLLRWRIYPPWRPFPSQRLLPGLRGDPSRRGQSA